MPGFKRTLQERESLEKEKARVAAFVTERFPEAEVEYWRDQGDYVALYIRIDDRQCWDVLDAVEPMLQQIAGEQPFLLGVVPLPSKQPLPV